MSLDSKIDLRTVLDGFGQGVLVFDGDGRLLAENLAARSLLGPDLTVIREQGWQAVTALFNTGITDPEARIETVRDRALKSERPVRFHIYHSGEYIPCWASAVQGRDGGSMHLMLTLETPDWSFVGDLVDKFRSEMGRAVDDTLGHITLINKTIRQQSEKSTAQELARRIGSFTTLIEVHMIRTRRLMQMFERLEDIRTGRLREHVQRDRKKIVLESFLEDFLEELDEIELVDPETEARDHRSRITTTLLEEELAVNVSPRYLTRILQDILANAIMYSLRGTAIEIKAQVRNQAVQLDIVDEGYGIRQKESDRVFTPFQRGRQPQIISEFGHGLSLYLCKHEVEAMKGRLWFSGEEGVGSTFSIMLPLWRAETTETAETAASASESDTKA